MSGLGLESELPTLLWTIVSQLPVIKYYFIRHHDRSLNILFFKNIFAFEYTGSSLLQGKLLALSLVAPNCSGGYLSCGTGLPASVATSAVAVPGMHRL